VGAASANRGCSADTSHTAVPASVSVPIWGTPVEMLLAHETIHRLDVLASSTCNTHASATFERAPTYHNL
jgi:hypothetical protein